MCVCVWVSLNLLSLSLSFSLSLSLFLSLSFFLSLFLSLFLSFSLCPVNVSAKWRLHQSERRLACLLARPDRASKGDASSTSPNRSLDRPSRSASVTSGGSRRTSVCVVCCVAHTSQHRPVKHSRKKDCCACSRSSGSRSAKGGRTRCSMRGAVTSAPVKQNTGIGQTIHNTAQHSTAEVCVSARIVPHW